jgi:hypothetical protein
MRNEVEIIMIIILSYIYISGRLSIIYRCHKLVIKHRPIINHLHLNNRPHLECYIAHRNNPPHLECYITYMPVYDKTWRALQI